MAIGKKSARLTVDLGDAQLYRAIRHAAIERDQPVRQIVIDALREWLERQEEADDLAAIAEAENDPTFPWKVCARRCARHGKSGVPDKVYRLHPYVCGTAKTSIADCSLMPPACLNAACSGRGRC